MGRHLVLWSPSFSTIESYASALGYFVSVEFDRRV